MIFRILHEGQFRVQGGDIDRINEIDNQIVAATAEGDDAKFQKLLQELFKTVHECGVAVPVDEFIESDVILPALDSTMDEVQHLFAGEGLIPG